MDRVPSPGLVATVHLGSSGRCCHWVPGGTFPFTGPSPTPPALPLSCLLPVTLLCLLALLCQGLYQLVAGPRGLGHATQLAISPKFSRSVVSDSLRPHGAYQAPHGVLPEDCLWDFPGKNTGVGCHFLLQCPPKILLNLNLRGQVSPRTSHSCRPNVGVPSTLASPPLQPPHSESSLLQLSPFSLSFFFFFWLCCKAGGTSLTRD